MEDVSAEEAANIAGWAPDRDNLHPFSALWSFPMFHHGLRWRVMLRVATTPLSAGELPMEKLALDPEKTYIAYDFWKQEYLGEVRGSFSCPALELGCCQVVAFYEKGNAPMVIASDRHVSMDAVSVLEHTWEHGVLSLRLKGVPGDTRRYQVWLPQGMQAASLRMKGCTAQLNAGQPAAITVTFEEEEAQVWLSVNG